MITKIVSGGQTGADRGALDAAIYAHIPHGGWCPKGRLAEDGPIPLKYDLKETGSKSYLQRTEWNVRDTDCTLVFTYGPVSGGTKRTVDFTIKHGKSCHVADLKGMDSKLVVDHICSWLLGQIEEEEFPPPPRHPVLNVAGPRGSKVKSIKDKVAAVMVDVLIRMNPNCGSLYPLTQPLDGVTKEQAANIVQVLTGDGWTVSEVTGKFPHYTQKPYDYREPKEACWFVSMVQSAVTIVGGDSRLVLISQSAGKLVADYSISGE